MRKTLLAYQISGQTVGVNIQTWSTDDLMGNQPFKIILSGTTIPTGYVDISSVVNWDMFGSSVANDYLCYKGEIKNLCVEIGWSNLTNLEKQLAITYNAYTNPTDAVIYLMTTSGMTQQQAQGYLLVEWHRHHGRLMVAARQRWYYVKFVVPQFLSFAESEDLLNTVNLLVLAYNDMGRSGKNYGDQRDGIMDYVESTNVFVGQGLRESGYTLLMGTFDDFITGIKNVIVNGIYNKYDDINLI